MKAYICMFWLLASDKTTYCYTPCIYMYISIIYEQFVELAWDILNHTFTNFFTHYTLPNKIDTEITSGHNHMQNMTKQLLIHVTMVMCRSKECQSMSYYICPHGYGNNYMNVWSLVNSYNIVLHRMLGNKCNVTLVRVKYEIWLTTWELSSSNLKRLFIFKSLSILQLI